MNETSDIENLLARSEEFVTTLYELLPPEKPDDDLRTQSVRSAIDIAIEHGFAIRVLIQSRALTSALSVFRLQYEAVVRAVWLQHAATDREVEKLMAPLNKESQQAANNSIPSYSGMMESIKNSVHPKLYQMLQAFRENSWKAVNSFVHAGLHALSRKRTGFPIPLLMTVVRQSNNLSHIAALLIPESQRNQDLELAIVGLHQQYGDCLQLEGAASST